jgi:hypothetical protein
VLGGKLLPGPAAADARGKLRHDVRARPRLLVAGLHQDPPARAGAGQGEAAGQLAAAQRERQVSRLVAGDVGGALVPDDHRAAASPLALVHALELTGRQGVILNGDGQAPDRGIERGSLRHGPRAQHAAGLDAQIEVQPRRVVQLHDEPRCRHQATVLLSGGLTPTR